MTPQPVTAPTSIAGSHFTDEQRLEAVTVFAMSGSMAEVSRRTGIAESTLSGWRHTEWWPRLVEEVRTRKNAEIDAGLTRVIEKAICAVEDRLDNGDVLLVKGEEVRVPVRAKDAAIVAGVMFDKRQQLRDPQNRPTREEAEEDLQRLADRLLALQSSVQRRIIEGEVKVLPEQSPSAIPPGFGPT
ncbi:MAG TPA: hypothetical protein VF816_00010 [Rhodocyclaceae bacterium]